MISQYRTYCPTPNITLYKTGENFVTERYALKVIHQNNDSASGMSLLATRFFV